MQRGANGLPDPTQIVPFVTGVNVPVYLTTGPGGDLFYVALGAGQLRRVSYPAATNHAPTAVATANPTSGAAPLAVQFTGSGSSDPDAGTTLTYAWDLDGDGAYDDSTAANPQWTYLSQAAVTASLRVTDPGGLSRHRLGGDLGRVTRRARTRWSRSTTRPRRCNGRWGRTCRSRAGRRTRRTARCRRRRCTGS